MSDTLQKAKVLVSAGPNAAPVWHEITVGLGVLARWEMEGPERLDGTHRVVSDFLASARHCDAGWVAWLILGDTHPFKEWLLKVLVFEWIGDDDEKAEVADATDEE